jgi:hypothetical protein
MGSGDPIRFKGGLTRADYLRLRRAMTPTWQRLLAWAAAAIAVLLAQAATGPVKYVGWAVFVLAGLIGFVLPAWRTRAAWDTNPEYRTTIEGYLSDSGFRWEDASRLLDAEWSALAGYRKRSDILIIFRRSGMGHWLLPRLFESRKDWERAVELVSTNLPKY